MRRVVRWSSRLPVFLWFVSVVSASAEEKALEPKVEEMRRVMSDVLTQSTSFAFKAEVSLDEFHETGLKVQKSAQRTMAVRRPDHIVTSVVGTGATGAPGTTARPFRSWASDTTPTRCSRRRSRSMPRWISWRTSTTSCYLFPTSSGPTFMSRCHQRPSLGLTWDCPPWKASCAIIWLSPTI